MNIKNIIGYARKTSLSVWAKNELASAHSYNDVKNILIEEIEEEGIILRNIPYEQRKIYEKRIKQAKNILRLMGINA